MSKERRDWSTAFSDAVNQLMTVCAGAIVVIAAFLERFTAGAKWQPLAGVAVLGFLLCLVTLVLAKVSFAAAAARSRDDDWDPFAAPSAWRFLSIGVSVFILSIGCLALFAARNFF